MSAKIPFLAANAVALNLGGPPGLTPLGDGLRRGRKLVEERFDLARQAQQLGDVIRQLASAWGLRVFDPSNRTVPALVLDVGAVP